MLTAIRQWVIRTMMKSKGETGIVQTMPKRDLVELNTQITAQRLMQSGIDPTTLKNANQVENAIIAIENKQKANLAENIRGGIGNTKSAKIFNTAGEELDPNQPIIGGTQPGKKIDTNFFIRNAEIKTRLEKGNKEAAQRIRDRKKLEDADDPNYDSEPADFDPDADNETFAIGGRVGLFAGSVPNIFKLLKNPKKIKQAIDNIFPTGDVKYDATMAAESLVELNPKIFGNKLYDDLDSMTRLDIYDAVISPMMANQAKALRMKKASKPTKTLEGIEKTGTINISDPEVAEEFARFMKETSPGDAKKLEQTLELDNFDPKGRKKNATGGRAGFFMGSANPKGLGLLKSLLNFFGKKSDVIKNPSDVLKVSNPKAFNKMLEDAKGKVMPKEGILATDAVKNYQTQMAKDRVDTVREMLERGKRFKAADDKIVGYKNEVKEKFMKDLNMSEADAENAANRMATLAMDVTKMKETPKITDEGLLQLENVLKNMETGGKKARELNADGGRIGFKDGMTRRTFLKIFGGLVSIPIVGKVLAPLKLTKGVSKVPIIKTDNVPGKPEWFDQLVNKVIIEGDDVTKKFATKDREIVHMKVLDEGTGGKQFPPGTPAADDTSIIVTQDLDNGAIRVEYRSTENMYGDPVQLQYKKPLPDEGDPRPTAEFDTAESYPVGRAFGPDDYEIEIDEIGGTSISDLTSDVSKLKEYATGKKPTLKEFVQSKKRKDKAKAISEGGENEAQAIIDRQGEFIQFDDLDPGDYASGGIARMLGE